MKEKELYISTDLNEYIAGLLLQPASTKTETAAHLQPQMDSRRCAPVTGPFGAPSPAPVSSRSIFSVLCSQKKKKSSVFSSSIFFLMRRTVARWPAVARSTGRVGGAERSVEGVPAAQVVHRAQPRFARVGAAERRRSRCSTTVRAWQPQPHSTLRPLPTPAI